MPRTEPPAAMRVGQDLAQWVLLRTAAGEPGESRLDAAAGRVASGTSGLWESAADGAFATRGPGAQSQTGGAATGVDGGASGLSQAQPEPARRRAPDLPLPPGRAGNQWSGPGLVQRHHVCADGLRVHVSGGGDGLVEPVCVGLGTIQQSGQRVLDRKSTRLNSSHLGISYAVFCLKKKNNHA